MRKVFNRKVLTFNFLSSGKSTTPYVYFQDYRQEKHMFLIRNLMCWLYRSKKTITFKHVLVCDENVAIFYESEVSKKGQVSRGHKKLSLQELLREDLK